MGESRTEVVLRIGLGAVGAQLAAGYVGFPDAPLNLPHYWIIWFAAFVMTLPNAAVIVLFRYRLRHPVAPDWGTALIAVTCLAWHGHALVLLSSRAGVRDVEFFVHVLADRTVSTFYQAVQVGAFAFVAVGSLLPGRLSRQSSAS